MLRYVVAKMLRYVVAKMLRYVVTPKKNAKPFWSANFDPVNYETYTTRLILYIL